MKTTVISFLVFSGVTLAAQSFSIELGWNAKDVQVGDSVRIVAKIKPVGGFDIPVFLSTQEKDFRGTIVLSRKTIDYPYTDSSIITLVPTQLDIGLRQIDLIGVNGSFKVTHSVIISVLESGAWKIICPTSISGASSFFHNSFKKRILINGKRIFQFSSKAVIDTNEIQVDFLASCATRSEIWIAEKGTNDIFRFDGSYWRSVSKPAFLSGNVISLICDSREIIYAVTDEQQVVVYADSTWTELPITLEGKAGLAIDSSGGLWYRDASYLFHYNNAVLDSIQIPDLRGSQFSFESSAQTLNGVFADKFNRIWVPQYSRNKNTTIDSLLLRCYLGNGQWQTYDLSGSGIYYFPVRVQVTNDSGVWVVLRQFVPGGPAPPEILILELRGNQSMRHFKGANSIPNDFYGYDCLIEDNRSIWFTNFVYHYELDLYTPPPFKGWKNTITSVTSPPINQSQFLSTFPNPCSDEITILSRADDARDVLEISDMNGSFLYSNTIQVEYPHTVNVSKFVNGIYLIRRGVYYSTFVVYK